MDELRNQIMNSIDDSSIPDLSYSIKAVYLDRQANKKLPWWKNKLTWAIAVPSLAVATVAAIVLPLTVFKDKNENLIPVLNQALPTTEETYSVSTLSLANAISANVGILTEADQHQQNNGGSHGWDSWDGWNRMPNGQNSLNEVLKYCSEYMYVAEKMLNNNLKAEPDEFTHKTTKDGEEYNCVFNKDKAFECSFKFTESLKENKKEVGVKGVIGVKNTTFEVEGSRRNVEKDEPANLKLDVKFERNQTYWNWWQQKNPVLSFQERNYDNKVIYTFTYNEGASNVYVVELYTKQQVDSGNETVVNQSVAMNVTIYETIYSPYAGYYPQPQVFLFTVEKDEDNNLVLWLTNMGTKLFIDVRDTNGNYYYYLSQFNDPDPFGQYGKH